MGNSGIYVIVNSRNGKFYIGSAVDFKVREKEHFRDLRNRCHHCHHLQRAYNKEKDKSVFNLRPIFWCASDKVTLRKNEQWFLDMNKHCKENEVLYNTSMIASRPEMTPEVRAKIGAKSKGRISGDKNPMRNPAVAKKHSSSNNYMKTAAARKNLTERLLSLGERHPSKRHDVRHKIRVKAIGRHLGAKSPRAKKVIELSEKRIFGSVSEAARYYNTSAENIAAVCRNTQKTATGRKFAFVEGIVV